MSNVSFISIENKLDDAKVLLRQDKFCISETKLDESFRTAKFAIKGFNKPYRLDVTAYIGGILFYVRITCHRNQLVYRIS